VLQALTGLALQLKVVQRLFDSDRAAARAALAELEALVASEQRDLRFFVRQMKPLPLSRTEINAGLIEQLGELGARVERQWGLRVELAVEPLPQLSETLALAIYRLLQESLANAARHSRARLARVRLGAQGKRLRIEIADDGCGFDFRGRYDLVTLTRLQIGPESIKQRVASLDGALVVVSEPTGARLEIDLPLLSPAAGATPTSAALAGLAERTEVSG
jgi:signal transduction histidine kinase